MVALHGLFPSSPELQ